MEDMRIEIERLVSQAAGQVETAAKTLSQWHVADIIEVLNRLSPEIAVKILRHVSDETALRIFNAAGLDRPSKLSELLPQERIVALLDRMQPDRRAEIFRGMSAGARARLFNKLDPGAKTSLDRILQYPPDKAGGIMTTEFVTVPADWTVKDVLDHIRASSAQTEQIYAIYVVDPQSRRLLQTVSLRQLLIAAPETNVSSAAAQRRPVTVTPDTDREEVARLISKYDLLAVPVIDEIGTIIGIVTVDDVIDAIVAETTEDVQKFGGMEAIDGPYLRVGFLTMIRKRAGWLAALFLSEMLTASAMQHYSAELEKAVVLTLFIPLIMSSGGNSGSQATSLVIRALALRELKLRDWWLVASREIPTGLVLGAILAVIGIVRIVVWQKLGIFDYGEHWLLVAATVGAALVGIVTFGSLAGSMLPFALKRLGFDPASASAPFVATLVDVTGLVIYFSVALVILEGTLL
jgi:magnesium transporter